MRFALILSSFLAVTACGTIAASPSNVDASAASESDGASPSNDAAKADAATDFTSSSDPNDPSVLPPSLKLTCQTDAAAPSPSGKPCDRSRIVVEVGHGSSSPDCGNVGAYCDSFGFQLSQSPDGGPPLPSGFSCWHELGQIGCSRSNEAGAGHVLTDEDIEAACEATQMLPVTVVCYVATR